MKKNMRKIVILAVMFVISFNCFAEATKWDGYIESSQQRIERAEEMLKFEEELREYNIEYYNWQEKCRKLKEKYYKAQIEYQKAEMKRLAKIKKMNEAKDATVNASTKEEKSAAYKKYRTLSKQVAKFRLLKAPKYPELPEAPERPKCLGLPETSERLELPKTN